MASEKPYATKTARDKTLRARRNARRHDKGQKENVPEGYTIL